MSSDEQKDPFIEWLQNEITDKQVQIILKKKFKSLQFLSKKTEKAITKIINKELKKLKVNKHEINKYNEQILNIIKLKNEKKNKKQKAKKKEKIEQEKLEFLEFLNSQKINKFIINETVLEYQSKTVFFSSDLKKLQSFARSIRWKIESRYKGTFHVDIKNLLNLYYKENNIFLKAEKEDIDLLKENEFFQQEIEKKRMQMFKNVTKELNEVEERINELENLLNDSEVEEEYNESIDFFRANKKKKNIDTFAFGWEYQDKGKKHSQTKIKEKTKKLSKINEILTPNKRNKSFQKRRKSRSLLRNKSSLPSSRKHILQNKFQKTFDLSPSSTEIIKRKKEVQKNETIGNIEHYLKISNLDDNLLEKLNLKEILNLLKDKREFLKDDLEFFKIEASKLSENETIKNENSLFIRKKEKLIKNTDKIKAKNITANIEDRLIINNEISKIKNQEKSIKAKSNYNAHIQNIRESEKLFLYNFNLGGMSISKRKLTNTLFPEFEFNKKTHSIKDEEIFFFETMQNAVDFVDNFNQYGSAENIVNMEQKYKINFLLYKKPNFLFENTLQTKQTTFFQEKKNIYFVKLIKQIPAQYQLRWNSLKLSEQAINKLMELADQVIFCKKSFESLRDIAFNDYSSSQKQNISELEIEYRTRSYGVGMNNELNKFDQILMEFENEYGCLVNMGKLSVGNSWILIGEIKNFDVEKKVDLQERISKHINLLLLGKKAIIPKITNEKEMFQINLIDFSIKKNQKSNFKTIDTLLSLRKSKRQVGSFDSWRVIEQTMDFMYLADVIMMEKNVNLLREKGIEMDTIFEVTESMWKSFKKRHGDKIKKKIIGQTTNNYLFEENNRKLIDFEKTFISTFEGQFNGDFISFLAKGSLLKNLFGESLEENQLWFNWLSKNKFDSIPYFKKFLEKLIFFIDSSNVNNFQKMEILKEFFQVWQFSSKMTLEKNQSIFIQLYKNLLKKYKKIQKNYIPSSTKKLNQNIYKNLLEIEKFGQNRKIKNDKKRASIINVIEELKEVEKVHNSLEEAYDYSLQKLKKKFNQTYQKHEKKMEIIDDSTKVINCEKIVLREFNILIKNNIIPTLKRVNNSEMLVEKFCKSKFFEIFGNDHTIMSIYKESFNDDKEKKESENIKITNTMKKKSITAFDLLQTIEKFIEYFRSNKEKLISIFDQLYKHKQFEKMFSPHLNSKMPVEARTRFLIYLITHQNVTFSAAFKTKYLRFWNTRGLKKKESQINFKVEQIIEKIKTIQTTKKNKKRFFSLNPEAKMIKRNSKLNNQNNSKNSVFSKDKDSIEIEGKILNCKREAITLCGGRQEVNYKDALSISIESKSIETMTKESIWELILSMVLSREDYRAHSPKIKKMGISALIYINAFYLLSDQNLKRVLVKNFSKLCVPIPFLFKDVNDSFCFIAPFNSLSLKYKTDDGNVRELNPFYFPSMKFAFLETENVKNKIENLANNIFHGSELVFLPSKKDVENTHYFLSSTTRVTFTTNLDQKNRIAQSPLNMIIVDSTPFTTYSESTDFLCTVSNVVVLLRKEHHHEESFELFKNLERINKTRKNKILFIEIIETEMDVDVTTYNHWNKKVGVKEKDNVESKIIELVDFQCTFFDLKNSLKSLESIESKSKKVFMDLKSNSMNRILSKVNLLVEKIRVKKVKDLFSLQTKYHDQYLELEMQENKINISANFEKKNAFFRQQRLVFKIKELEYLTENLESLIVFQFIKDLYELTTSDKLTFLFFLESKLKKESLKIFEGQNKMLVGLKVVHILREVQKIYEVASFFLKISKNVKDMDNTSDTSNKNLSFSNSNNEFQSIQNNENLKQEKNFEKNTFYLNLLPQMMAKLFDNLYPLEIINGENLHINTQWIQQVITELKLLQQSTTHSMAKISVLSILGIQSSGKSTFINSLFNLHNPVKDDKCTKGSNAILMPIKKTDNTFPGEHSSPDYLLLIDTEGLGSIEIINEYSSEEQEKRDNQLITFNAGLSNMCIINSFREFNIRMIPIISSMMTSLMELDIRQINPLINYAFQGVESEKDNIYKLGEHTVDFLRRELRKVDLFLKGKKIEKDKKNTIDRMNIDEKFQIKEIVDSSIKKERGKIYYF